MHNPKICHIALTGRILQYLKSTLRKGLLIRNNGHLNVQGYTDISYAWDVGDKRSTMGMCVFIGGNLILWRTKKQIWFQDRQQN